MRYMHRILIVEDEVKIREELKTFLEKNNYQVEILTDFESSLDRILSFTGNLILLDINIPSLDGQYLCKEIRKTSDIPVIIVTSKNTELDELLSMNYGADDFITKPYNLQILLARIERILKRTNNINTNIIHFANATLKMGTCEIEYNDKKLEISKNEMKILHCLLEKKGNIVTREEIMIKLWDSEFYIDDNTLTVNMNRLRKKLEEIGMTDIIETKRGLGYIIK